MKVIPSNMKTEVHFIVELYDSPWFQPFLSTKTCIKETHCWTQNILRSYEHELTFDFQMHCSYIQLKSTYISQLSDGSIIEKISFLLYRSHSRKNESIHRKKSENVTLHLWAWSKLATNKEPLGNLILSGFCVQIHILEQGGLLTAPMALICISCTETDGSGKGERGDLQQEINHLNVKFVIKIIY